MTKMNNCAKLFSSFRRFPLRVIRASRQPLNNFSTGCLSLQRKYTKRHEWITTSSGGKNERVGVTDYAQDALGEIVYVALPEVGRKVKRYDECGAVESVKAATEIYAPLDGTVKSVNADVESNPSLLNTDPYEKGWVFMMTIDDAKDMDLLLNEKQYEAFLEAEKPI